MLWPDFDAADLVDRQMLVKNRILLEQDLEYKLRLIICGEPDLLYLKKLLMKWSLQHPKSTCSEQTKILTNK